MRKQGIWYLSVLVLAFVAAGCTVRTYPLTRDRVDQDLTEGNKGFVLGQAPTQAEMERATTRETRVFEFEFGRPVKVEPKKSTTTPVAPISTSEPMEQNQGYITESATPEVTEEAPVNFEKYTVQKNDTLQKISQKFYGTTKKWKKIFDANKDTLKGPDKVYAGQVLNIPAEAMKETPENLK